MANQPTPSQRVPAASPKADERKPALAEEERRAKVRAAIEESASRNAELLRRLAK